MTDDLRAHIEEIVAAEANGGIGDWMIDAMVDRLVPLVAGHASIVRDLAAAPAPLSANDWEEWCAFCRVMDGDFTGRLNDPAAHEEACPWRRARQADALDHPRTVWVVEWEMPYEGGGWSSVWTTEEAARREAARLTETRLPGQEFGVVKAELDDPERLD